MKTEKEIRAEFDRLGKEFRKIKNPEPGTKNLLDEWQEVIDKKTKLNAKQEIILWVLDI